MTEKAFIYVNPAAKREYNDLPNEIKKDFGVSLSAIQNNMKPFLETTSLDSIGAGVIELKVQGSPAYRCVYIAKYANTVFILHSFSKTTNGVDRKAIKTATLRYRELMNRLRKLDKEKKQNAKKQNRKQ